MNSHVHNLFESMLNRFSGAAPVLPDMSVNPATEAGVCLHPKVFSANKSSAVFAPNSPGELLAATFIGRTLTGGERGRGGLPPLQREDQATGAWCRCKPRSFLKPSGER